VPHDIYTDLNDRYSPKSSHSIKRAFVSEDIKLKFPLTTMDGG
jgi:hypothetical protein